MTAPTLHQATRPTPARRAGTDRAAVERPATSSQQASVPQATRRADFATATAMLTPRTRRPAGPREFSHADAGPVPARDESGIRPPAELGDPTALCCAVAHAAIESLRGIRPLTQLARSVSPEIFDALHARAQVRADARRRTGAPPAGQERQLRSRVRRARVVRLAPGVAEATVVVDDVDRVRAAAVRVEEHRGRWRVVVLEIG